MIPRDETLGRVALAIAGACVVVLCSTVLALSAPRLSEYFGWAAPAVSYSPGDRIDVDPAVSGAASRIIFFFARSTCTACQASKPVMAAIIADVEKTPEVRVFLVTNETRGDEEREFATALGVDESGHIRSNLGALKVRYVPTTVVTDARGTVLLSREGLLTEGDRVDIVRTATASTAD